MKRTFLAILAGVCLVAAAPLAASADVPSNERQIARLTEYAQHLDLKSREKLGARQRTEIEARRNAIRELVRRLQAGETVDPSEVDRLLGQAALGRE
jgi:hypothetical protein